MIVLFGRDVNVVRRYRLRIAVGNEANGCVDVRRRGVKRVPVGLALVERDLVLIGRVRTESCQANVMPVLRSPDRLVVGRDLHEFRRLFAGCVERPSAARHRRLAGLRREEPDRHLRRRRTLQVRCHGKRRLRTGQNGERNLDVAIVRFRRTRHRRRVGAGFLRFGRTPFTDRVRICRNNRTVLRLDDNDRRLHLTVISCVRRRRRDDWLRFARL